MKPAAEGLRRGPGRLQQWLSTNLTFNGVIILFHAILIGTLWISVIAILRNDRENTTRAAITRNQNLAIAFEQYTTRIIESADLVVRNLLREQARSEEKLSLVQFVAEHRVDNPALDGVTITNERGDAHFVANSASSVSETNLADRAHFKVHINRDSGKLFIGQPIIGRLTGTNVIPLTRRINKPDGTFGGMAMVSIEPSIFTDFLHAAELNPLAIISVVGLDGVTRARLRGKTVSSGEDINKGPLFAEIAKRGQVGSYLGKGTLDEVSRFFSFRILPNYELVCTVGTPAAEVMAEFNQRRSLYFRATGLASVVITGFAVLMMTALANRKRAETALREQAEASRIAEERTQLTLLNAGLGTWDMDYATGTFRISEIMEAQLGLMPGTFGGTLDSLVQYVHPQDRPAMAATMVEAAQSGKDFSSEYRFQRPDGTIVWLNRKGRVQLGEQGQPLRGVGISMDVSDRHQLEEQFHQAQKMEAVGRLAGGVAHDFNNLLTVILGNCELLLEGTDQGDPRAADIVHISEAGMRAAALTRQLLAFSRKQIIEPTQLDLNAIVADIRGMLARLIGEDVKIVMALSSNATLLRADRGQIEQVVMNLAVNARDAMPNGGTLTIETTTVELDEHYVSTQFDVKPGPYVVLTVTDTGMGMTADVRARLFEPFFTTKEAGKGTGLGLATVYGIATGSGGSIGVYSEPGKGTAFKVYFPRAEAAPLVAGSPAPVTRSHRGAQTIMVVEDEPGLRELAQRILQRLGYTVVAAADAAEARRLFDQHPAIDLLLTDVVMPGASGPELTSQLRELRPTLKVLYMSGYTEDAIVHHGVLKSGIAFLNKPFTMQSLGEKLREVLEN